MDEVSTIVIITKNNKNVNILMLASVITLLSNDINYGIINTKF